MYRFAAGADQVYVIPAARASTDGVAIPTSATGTLTVRGAATGENVEGQIWPAIVAWSAAQNAFTGVIQGSIIVSDRGIYEILVTLDGGPGLQWAEVEEMRADGSTENAAGVQIEAAEAPVELPEITIDSSGAESEGGSGTLQVGEYDTSGAIDPSVCFASEDWPYADTAALQAHMGTSNDVGKKYWQVVNPSFATIDPAVTLAGHHTLKHTLPGGGSAATFQPQIVFRNALNGGDGTNTPLYSALWARYRWRFTDGFEITGKGPGFPPNSSESFKAAAFGWFGGTSGHASGRSTHEFHGAGAGLKIGLGATGGALNFTDIATVDQETGAAGALFTDELFRDMVGLFEYTAAYAFRLRWWRAITGFVPTKIVDITGTVDIAPGHESDPQIPDPDLVGHANHVIVRPYFDRFYLGLNYNRERDIARSLHWGSWELANGAVYANPFKLPAQELL